MVVGRVPQSRLGTAGENPAAVLLLVLCDTPVLYSGKLSECAFHGFYLTVRCDRRRQYRIVSTADTLQEIEGSRCPRIQVGGFRQARCQSTGRMYLETFLNRCTLNIIEDLLKCVHGFLAI